MTARVRRKTVTADLPEYSLPFMPEREKPARSTSQTDPIQVGWVEIPGQPSTTGRLGVTFAPGKRGFAMLSNTYHDRDLEADLERLVTVHGANILFDCTEPGERVKVLSIPNMAQAAAKAGLTYHNLPIPDVTAPRTVKAAVVAVNAVTNLAADLLGGYTVVINCRGGRGRSGMMAACVLAALGVWPDEAIERVRKGRKGAVETREQEGFVWQAALRLLPLGWGDPRWAESEIQ